MSLCVNVHVCTCLFCLAVPTVLAGKWSPPARTHPGGIRLRGLGGGHHQQNISDLQRCTGTVTQWGHASNRKVVCFGEEKNKLCICLSGLTSRFSALLRIFCNFCNLFVSPAVITTANLFCDCTPHTSHSYAGLSIQAVQKQSFCSLTMPLHL